MYSATLESNYKITSNRNYIAVRRN
ncbi:uncharacterized protein METZ01_LOCUS472363, partial [marine metagenome]